MSTASSQVDLWPGETQPGEFARQVRAGAIEAHRAAARVRAWEMEQELAGAEAELDAIRKQDAPDEERLLRAEGRVEEVGAVLGDVRRELRELEDELAAALNPSPSG